MHRLERAVSCCSSDAARSPEGTQVDQAGNEQKEINSNGMAGPSGDERRDLGTKPVCLGKAALLR